MSSASNTVLITVASWEDRFRSGSERILRERDCERVLMYYFSEYDDWTKENRRHVRALCSHRRIPCDEYDLSFGSPVKSWLQIVKTFEPFLVGTRNYIVDITTMPRETIWTTFWLLDESGVPVEYVYHKPNDYGELAQP